MRKSSISFVLVAIVMAMIVIPAQLLCAQDSLRTSRVLAPVSDQQVVALNGHVVPWANKTNDLGIVPDSMPMKIHMLLKRSDVQEAALQKFLAEQQDRKSANYHKWLKPEEYGTRFGISDADIAKLTSWLTSHGFTVDKVAKGSNIIGFSGTSGQVREALHTELHNYKVGNEAHYANASNPMVPAALAPVISGFQGLNDMKPKPLHTAPKVAKFNKASRSWHVAEQSPAGAKPEFEWASAGMHLLAPGDFATIYGVRNLWDTYDGTGQTIAIVAASDINPKDIDNFRTNFGLPEKKLNIIYDGPNPGLVGSESEAALDVEWAGAIAPQATIDLVVNQDVSAAILYAVDNNLAPVLSISWGECELGLQTSGNEWFSEVYKQAASQGITVLVAAGDSGSATCDQGSLDAAYYGLAVSGFASTPYNVAVGGTDFPVNFFGDPSKYWNSSNDAVDQHSALSYIPEAPWNDSCASPQVLALAQALAQRYPADYGLWAEDTTNEMLCNDSRIVGPSDRPVTAQSYFLNVVGGGGGISNCTNTSTVDPKDCTTGYAQPAWQAGVLGVADDARRHVPDVSFFAGNGIWGSGYLFCESDATLTGTCDLTNDGDMLYAGGTSFAAPAFAGIVALLNQKVASPLGNLNPTLYQLAATQLKADAPGACKSDNINGTDTCVFHDITQGSNVMPCVAGTSDDPPSGTCTVQNSSDRYGVLSGFPTGTGYDNASGLGSINAYNLFNGWPDGLAATQTTLKISSTNLKYGAQVSGTVQVTAASGTPTGTVALMYQDSNGIARSGWAPGDVNNGTATIVGYSLPVGTYTVYARYGGDASYGASASAGQVVTVSQAPTLVGVQTNRTSVGETESAQIIATLESSSYGDAPTGNVVFKNTTTGAVIDTVGISPYVDSRSGYLYARAITTAGVGILTHGANQITATYTGDANYVTSTGSAPAIQYNGGFSITASSSSITLTPGATSGNTVVFTLTPSSDKMPLSPSSISLSCPGILPTGVSCQFSAPTQGASNGAVSSTLTLVLSSPLAQNSPAPLLPIHHGLAYLAMMIVGAVFVTVPRKRSAIVATGLVLAMMAAFTFGCGGSSHKESPTPTPATTTVALSASTTTPALNSAVTLKATLSNSAATGTVSFYDGTNFLGSSAVSNGAASLTTSSLPIGARTITAKYSGDSTYPAASSAALAVDVAFTSTITAQAVDTATGNLAQQSVSFTVK